MAENTNQSRVVIGLVILAAGALLLMRNLFWPFGFLNFIFSWKMILVAVGLVLYFTSENKTSGIVLMVIGGFLLITDISGIPFSRLWRTALPLLLVVTGVILIMHAGLKGKRGSIEKVDVSADSLKEVAVLGGITKNIFSKSFKGGEVTAVLGGAEINLANSGLSEGSNVLEMTAILGGITLFVPDDWQIRTEIVSVLGAFTDNRPAGWPAPGDTGNELIIKGFILLGGGEIKSSR